MSPTIIVKLTAAQIKTLEPLFAMSRQAAEDDRPGMVLAQIFSDGIRAKFLSYDNAKGIALTTNGKIAVRSGASSRDHIHDEDPTS